MEVIYSSETLESLRTIDCTHRIGVCADQTGSFTTLVFTEHLQTGLFFPRAQKRKLNSMVTCLKKLPCYSEQLGATDRSYILCHHVPDHKEQLLIAIATMSPHPNHNESYHHTAPLSLRQAGTLHLLWERD
jgi:hypothetical protein